MKVAEGLNLAPVLEFLISVLSCVFYLIFHCDNNKCGEWTSYHTNGSINTIASFSNGLKDGIWRFYDKDGILIYEVLYRSNVRVRVSEHTYFTAQVE